MQTPDGVFGDIINNDRLAALADFMADCGFNPKLTSRLQPEVDFIEHAAGNPAILGHTRHSRKPHPRGAAHYIEDRWNGFYATYAVDIGLKVMLRGSS